MRAVLKSDLLLPVSVVCHQKIVRWSQPHDPGHPARDVEPMLASHMQQRVEKTNKLIFDLKTMENSFDTHGLTNIMSFS